MSATDSVIAQAARARDAADWSTARTLYAEAHKLRPQSAEIALELAICALRTADAAAAMRLASEVKDPNFLGRAAIVRGKIRQLAGHYDAAADEFEYALKDRKTPLKLRRPAVTLLADLTLNQFGDTHRAAELFANLRDTSPDKASEAQLVADMYSGRRRGRALADGFTAHAREFIDARSRLPQRPNSVKKKSHRPRIGILSPSLFATPVGFLTLGTLEVLSRQADLIFFDRRPHNDWLSASLREIACSWQDVSSSDERELATQIQQQSLDAVIDCGGWTDIQALRALSMRPCHRQFKWVGGQALTTGLNCFDGFLTDERQVPKSTESLYAEPIKRFSGSYVTYAPPPYFDFTAAQKIAQRNLPKAERRAYALVSNPAKISDETLRFIQSVKPKTLWLIDSRWRYQRTRSHLLPALERYSEKVEILTPNGHRAYLEALRDLPASFIDTRPYTMGLTAIELLLLGKPIVGPARRSGGLMYERHSLGHERAQRFDHYSSQALQLLRWCST